MSTSSFCLIACGVFTASLASLVDASGFIEDGKASLSFRNYYFDQDLRDVHVPGQKQWGQGIVLNYQSGFTGGVLGFGVDALSMVGIKLDDGGRLGKNQATRTPSAGGLFPTEHDGSSVDEYSSLGPTLKARVGQTELRWGTLMPQLPVVTRNDGRLLPQTFQGVQIRSQDIDNLVLIGGRLDNARGRASSDRRGLSIAGANHPSTGVFVNEFYYAGVDYKLTKNLQLQYYSGRLEDFYQQHFLGLQHGLDVPFGKLKTDLRYFRSAGIGRNRTLAGRLEGYKGEGYWAPGDTRKGEIDNRTWSSLFTLVVGGHEVGVGYQRMSGHSQHAYLNQGDGSITGLVTERLIIPFNNPEERTWLAQYRYDFTAVGLPGLTAGASYTRGSNIRTRQGDQGEFERDFELSYVVQSGPLRGVGMAWRNGMLRSDVRGDIDQNRIIVSYTLSLF